MRHTTYLFILLIGLLVLSSCTDDFMESVNGYAPKGTPVDAYLSLTVGDLDIDVATRATADEIEDTEAERRENDLWIFQYDAKTGKLILAPIYIGIKSQDELADIPVKLSDNNGDPCIIYVVTNSGSDEWGLSPTNFATVDREYHNSSWSADQTIRRVDILHLHAESNVYGLVKPFTHELYYYTKAVAGPLRCVRDTK